MHPSVRSLSRGLKILGELNGSGRCSAATLAQRTGLNRTTTYRLLTTLIDDGFVHFNDETGLFGLTSQVRLLSEGLTDRDETSQAAVPAMFKLLEDVSWPSDFGVFDSGSIVIQESTHSFSALSIHRGMVGRRRSLVRSALGKAILTAAKPRLRREMLEITAALEPADAPFAQNQGFIERLVRQTKKDGYASSVSETESKISAIALPIRRGNQVLGGINLIFFSSAMTPQLAASRYLKSLRQAVQSIEDKLATD